MQITNQQKHEAYVTISIQLGEMFDMVTRNFAKRGEMETAKLISEVEEEICDGWENFQRSPKKASEWTTV